MDTQLRTQFVNDDQASHSGLISQIKMPPQSRENIGPAALSEVKLYDRMPISVPIIDGHSILLRENRGLRVVVMHDITHIVAEQNYTWVHLRNAPSALMRRRMLEWEQILPPENFLRLERSLIISLECIQEVRVKSRDMTEVFLLGQKKSVVIKRLASQRLRKLLVK